MTPPLAPAQAVILVGGLGTRLGALTAQTPKPLIDVGGRPFLDYLLFEVARHGCRDVLLLAQYHADQVAEYARRSGVAARFGLTIDVLVEPERAGTGGALWHAAARLDESFYLLNGDSWLQTNLLALPQLAHSQPDGAPWKAVLSLRRVEDVRRYGSVLLNDARVTRFGEKTANPDAGLVNGGIYLLRRNILSSLQPTCSLETDVLPQLAEEGEVLGLEATDSYFIDIGVPEALAQAREDLPGIFHRPALFLDRDGVINKDHGYVGSTDRFEWIPGAGDAIRRANDRGWFVFVVSNQAGIARGFYGHEDVRRVQAHIQSELAMVGAHVDDFRYCPFHPDGVVEEYTGASDWRKPNPGMLLDIFDHWPVDRARSVLIGDQPTDIEAAGRAGIAGYLYEGSQPLDTFVSGVLG